MTKISNTLGLTASHWGAGVVRVQDGTLKRVDGHPSDTDASRINENYAHAIDGPARVRRPAVRESYLKEGYAGAAKTRGQERFVEVSWDTALELVAKELKRTIKNHGNKGIFAGSYGWASAGRFHHAQSQLKRFLNCSGGFVRSEGNYSYNAALVLMPHIVGHFREHVKQATRWSTVAAHGQLVVMFGGLPARSTQVGGGGLARHRVHDALMDCKRAGVEFINLSPLKTDAIPALEAEWLPPRPGSDTAVMMGLAHTLLTEDLCDHAFLKRYTVGFERVTENLLGHTDGVVKDVHWASRQSGISAHTLATLARRMAASRTLICTAVGLQRAEFGEQPLWMTVTLAAMLGHIGKPGGGYGIGYGADASIGTTDRPMRWPSLPQGENPVQDFIPVAAITDMLLNPGGQYAYNGCQRTYPDARLVWWAGGNPFHHHQDLNRLVKAFQTPETIIVNEINWTATARHADIVLPATSSLERDDFGAGTQDTALIPMPRAIAPIAEARDEYDIYTQLAQILGFEERFTQGRTSAQWLAAMWTEMQETAAETGRTLPTWETFLHGDVLEFDDPAPEHVFLSEFVNEPLRCRLPTPSGRIELHSKVIAGFAYDDCPGQASWLPPTEWLGADKAKQFPLHLISGQPETRLHSQWDAGSFSQSRKIHAREPIILHPNDAKRRGIADGDVVRVFNDRGACLAGAVISDEILERVVFLWTGAWYDPLYDGECDAMHGPTHTGNESAEQDKPLDKHGNPNVLTHDRRASRLSQGPAAHSALVDVEKFEGQLPDITAFDAPLTTQH